MDKEKMPPSTVCCGIIPARWESSRFPGKPLADILGKPMFWHVYQRARRCTGLNQVILATDDERIRAAAQKLDVPVVMTRRDHRSGTERILEAAEIIKLPPEAIVINIQGDEPCLDPSALNRLLKPFNDNTVGATTLACPMSPRQRQNPDRVKVVFDHRARALYFSRAAIPYGKNGHHPPTYLHIGIYAFRMSILKDFAAYLPGPLETAENLEQLRLLENGHAIHVVLVEHESIGVDRPADLARVIKLLACEQGKKPLES